MTCTIVDVGTNANQCIENANYLLETITNLENDYGSLQAAVNILNLPYRPTVAFRMPMLNSLSIEGYLTATVITEQPISCRYVPNNRSSLALGNSNFTRKGYMIESAATNIIPSTTGSYSSITYTSLPSNSYCFSVWMKDGEPSTYTGTTETTGDGYTRYYHVTDTITEYVFTKSASTASAIYAQLETGAYPSSTIYNNSALSSSTYTYSGGSIVTRDLGGLQSDTTISGRYLISCDVTFHAFPTSEAIMMNLTNGHNVTVTSTGLVTYRGLQLQATLNTKHRLVVGTSYSKTLLRLDSSRAQGTGVTSTTYQVALTSEYGLGYSVKHYKIYTSGVLSQYEIFL